MLKDWLLQPTEFMLHGQVETKLNLFRVPCLFLIRQIMQYNEEPGANFDGIMGVLGCILGLREYESRIAQTINQQPKENRFKSILNNNKIFNERTISGQEGRPMVQENGGKIYANHMA
mgnify:CR=1 FL=1